MLAFSVLELHYFTRGFLLNCVIFFFCFEKGKFQCDYPEISVSLFRALFLIKLSPINPQLKRIDLICPECE